jgi:hypothetical protein
MYLRILLHLFVQKNLTIPHLPFAQKIRRILLHRFVPKILTYRRIPVFRRFH